MLHDARTALLRRGRLLALLAGALTTLGFAPFNLWPLAIAGPALLFWLWLHAGRDSGFRLGLLYGLGLMGSGVTWLHVSLAQFGDVGWFLPLLVTGLFVLVMALYYGLLGWLVSRIPVAKRLRLSLLFPAAWVLIEWLRGWFLSGFPWLQLGYAQIDSPLAGLGPLFGSLGVSWAAAFSAGLLVLILITTARRTRLKALAMLGVLWVAAWGVSQIEWSHPEGEPIRVALVQGNIPQAEKWKLGQLAPTLIHYAKETRRHLDADLILWPETAVPAFQFQVEEPFLQGMHRLLQEQGHNLVFGVVQMDPESKAYYNAMVSLGSERAHYHKRHLVPFTEYLPLKDWLGSLVDFLTIPMSDFAHGSSAQPLMQVGEHQVGMSICYEDAFGSEMIEALPQAAYLINASNDAWFGDSLAPHQHLQIARMRALETGRYLLRATNTGISAVIGPKGELIGVSPLLQRHVLRSEIRAMQGLTPYARIGNWGIVILMLFALMVAYPCNYWRGA